MTTIEADHTNCDLQHRLCRRSRRGGALANITALLVRAQQGDPQACNDLFAVVYAELSRLAQRKLAREQRFSTLDTGGLVHEAYLCLMQQQRLPGGNRRMFFAYAAQVMRSVLIDHARKRNAEKRDHRLQVTLRTEDAEALSTAPDVQLLDAALRELAAIDRRAHDIVELRYFGGLSLEEVADALQISVITVKRDWKKARAFLYSALHVNAG
jgi:RNA polymerase sigma factor (TIGR02999 family)